MSVDQRNIVNELDGKIQRLMRVYERVVIERDNLRKSIKECENKIGELTESVSQLTEKNKKLQLADAFKASSEDTHDAKLKIGRIVREIDKCMALLNK